MPSNYRQYWRWLDLIWPSDRLEITYNFENWMRYMYVKRQCSTCIFLCFLVEPCRIVPKLCWDSFRHYEYGGQFDRIYHTLGGRKHYQLQCKNEVTLACLPPSSQMAFLWHFPSSLSANIRILENSLSYHCGLLHHFQHDFCHFRQSGNSTLEYLLGTKYEICKKSWKIKQKMRLLCHFQP